MNDDYRKIFEDLVESVRKNPPGQKGLDIVVNYMKTFWWKYVIYALTTGILALFVASLVLDSSITVDVMNSWVGIVLGLVALVIGVISMFLSFYNLDQSIKTQEKTLETIEKIKTEIISTVRETARDTKEAVEKNQNQTADVFNVNGKNKKWSDKDD